MKARLTAVSAGTALVLAIAGCGGSPTGAGGTAEGSEDGPAAIDDVYAELEGLEGEERLERLEELAVEEDTSLTWYTTTPLGDSEPLTEGFADKHGIDVEIYRASSADLLRRVLEESRAGHGGADLVTNNGVEMQILDNEELLLPLETELRDDIADGARFDTWLGMYLNVSAAAWNTNALGEGDAPTSWKQVLTGYQGRLAMEAKAWDWFATLVRDHFMKDMGMTEKQAVDLFRRAARGADIVDGNTAIAEFLVAGQYDVVTSTYKNHIAELGSKGGPVTWEPAIEPLVLTVNGTGIHRRTDAPATALLFLEYTLTDGQEILVDAYRTPANTEYGDDVEQYETVVADVEDMVEQRDKWEKLYDQVVRESGSDVIEDN